MTKNNAKQEVRQFYDQIGWSQEEDGNYQNARYEDLRPVSREYISRTRLRVNKHLLPSGRFLLDAGSGPVQYPEYLTYSEGYDYRVCADISITALQEAKKRLGAHAQPVVADVANLPFASDAFDGIVSMHTIHHLPMEEHRAAYKDLYRVLGAGKKAVIINGWSDPFLMKLFEPLIQLGRVLTGRPTQYGKKKGSDGEKESGTFVRKMNARWLQKELNELFPVQIYSWRSLSTRFLRWFIKPKFAGKFFLRVIFWKEDKFSRFFGKHGQYPMVVFQKEDK
ncbi:MAG: class I SAM-dependent methyltransferase [Anaerolineae bacterium]|jgi:SAM-dependent methyltransferase|nr:class I SAM-dependent methyltransferase [Anaerolineae bacterium]MBT7989853.1 class I SAM-dependent methyltransferase [Anaerolineae bacterium]